MFFHVTEEGWEEGEEKGKGVEGKFSIRIVCQNIIPFALAVYMFYRILFIEINAERIEGAMPCHDYKGLGEGPEGCF